MDILELLSNVIVVDTDGNEVGDTLAFHIVQGDKLIISVDIAEEVEPEDPAREAIPEEDNSSNIRVVSGG